MIAQHFAHFRRIVLRIAALSAVSITVSTIVAACSWQEPVSVRATSRPAQAPSVGHDAAAVALRQVGVPYRYGGSSPSGFDCSGLVHYSYRNAGRPVPRTTGQLWHASDTVSRDQLQAGDLLFFRIGGKMSHVGMYIGDGRFVHAPSSGRAVSVETLGSAFYRQAFVRAGRP